MTPDTRVYLKMVVSVVDVDRIYREFLHDMMSEKEQEDGAMFLKRYVLKLKKKIQSWLSKNWLTEYMKWPCKNQGFLKLCFGVIRMLMKKL